MNPLVELEMKRTQILKELEEAKTRILLEMGNVDKHSLANFRQLISSYAKIENDIDKKLVTLKDENQNFCDMVRETMLSMRTDLKLSLNLQFPKGYVQEEISKALDNALKTTPEIATKKDIRNVKQEVYNEMFSELKSDLSNLPLYKTPIENTAVDLNTMLTVGSYCFSGCTFQNLPYELFSNGLPPHYIVVEKLMERGSVIWIKQTIGRYDLPFEYFRIYYNTIFVSWKRTDGVIMSTGDNTDRTTEINNLLSRHKYVKLGVGEFHVGMLKVPEGCTLEGCGEKTILVKIETDEYLPTIRAYSKSTIKDLTIKGTLTEQPTAETTYDRNRIGIAVEGVVDPIIIKNCRITGFSYSGINILNTGTSCKSVLISDCEITNCRVGINIVSSEYMTISNVICRDNWIGCNNAGGNNRFTGCGFDSNGWGFVVADDANDGHGSCVACSFNHNENRAISVQKINFGFVFSGCQIHYGSVAIDDSSKGILFSGCEFGGSAVITHYAPYFPLFINSCMFYQDIRNEEGYLATNIIYNNSYLFNGTPITND